MAFPTVEHRGSATQSGATQSYSIPGGAMAAGELLVVLLGNAAGTDSAMAFVDTGWDSGTQTNQGNDAGMIVGWYYSDSGGETSFDISAQSGIDTIAMMYVLSGAADPAVLAPDLGGGSNGDSSSRNPPAVTITNGPQDVLVICGWAQEAGANGGQPSTPTNYSNALYQESGVDAGGSAERQVNASSEDPAAFTGGTVDNWACDTVAIHAGAQATYEQEGYRWRNDDGSEMTATWKENQDTTTTVDKETTVRLRVLTDIDGDPGSDAYTLQYKRDDEGSGEWRNV